MKMYNKEGITMVDVKRVEKDGDNLAMVCKLMGAYSMKIYLTPKELRQALQLVDWDLIRYLPEMLIKDTRGEEKICRMAETMGKMLLTDSKLLLGPGGGEKLQSAVKEAGAVTMQGLVESLLLLLQVVLEDK